MKRAFPLAAAAFAARIELRALRAWLDRGAISFTALADRKPGQWRHAAPVDVARAAITARLLRYGYDLQEAAEVLSATFDRHLGDLLDARASMPEIVARLAGCRVLTSRHRGRIKTEMLASADPIDGHVLALDLGRIAANAAAHLDLWLAAEAGFLLGAGEHRRGGGGDGPGGANPAAVPPAGPPSPGPAPTLPTTAVTAAPSNGANQ